MKITNDNDEIDDDLRNVTPPAKFSFYESR